MSTSSQYSTITQVTIPPSRCGELTGPYTAASVIITTESPIPDLGVDQPAALPGEPLTHLLSAERRGIEGDRGRAVSHHQAPG